MFSLDEASDKLTHIEHVEDQIFMGGINGIRNSLNFIRSVRDELLGHESGKINLTTKFDGSPSIVAGYEPKSGKFFVGTKSVFGKNNPRINYTSSDIDNFYGEVPDLAAKLKVCLKELPNVVRSGIYQGDFMFYKKSVFRKTIEGEKYIVFRPNTISYAVPADSDLASQILNAQMGIVWHTRYTGSDIQSLKASFDASIDMFAASNRVWQRDVFFRDLSGTISFTKTESAKLSSILSSLGKKFNEIDSSVANEIAFNKKLNGLIIQYHNSQIRAGEAISNVPAYVSGLIDWIEDKFHSTLQTLKTSSGKLARTEQNNELLFFLESNKSQLVKLFELMNLFVDAKIFLINKLATLSELSTFMETEDGYKVIAPEGFVASDHMGNIVKLVDRLTFSRLNFIGH